MNADVSRSSTRLYLGIWGALMALLIMTWGISRVDLGELNIFAAMTIAVVKMMLVILFFMHVRHSPRITWLFVAAGFFWLILMMTLTLGDYLTRNNLFP